jgi:hypothetical protein
MLVFSGTTNTLKVNTAIAWVTTAPTILTCWRDIGADDSYVAKKQTLVLAQNTTLQSVTTAPSLSTIQQVLDFFSFRNRDTVSHTVTVSDDVGGTPTEIFSVVLTPGECLQYTDKQGFSVLTAAGATKLVTVAGISPVSSLLQMTILGADVTNNASANTVADVTGLSFAVTAGLRYRFKFFIWYTAAAGTTGSRWSISGPATPTQLIYRSEYSLSATTRTLNDQLTAYDLPAASNASSATAGNIAIIEGLIVPSANGNVIARFASEVASSAIVAKTGSYVEFQNI